MSRIGYVFVGIAALSMTSCEPVSMRDGAFDCASFLYRFHSERAQAVNDVAPSDYGRELLAMYTPFRLTTDLSILSVRQCRMIPHLIEAARAMDDVFWMQAYGDREELLKSIADPAIREFAGINYGPWDRLNGNAPFLDGVQEKPQGANFYPHDMTRAEFESAALNDPELTSPYSVVVRDEDERLRAIPYHQAFPFQMEYASDELLAAAELAEEPGLKRYLMLRAEALLTGDYRESDLAWMDMKENTIEVVIGPIETYEDRLFGYKASAEAFVLIKDLEWSSRLARYADLLPVLQEGLPAPEEYKREMPGTDSDLNAYDAIYYAGEANAGSKTIAINLPNDEQVQLEKGTRRLQLKNVMRAKYDEILRPIAEVLITPSQRAHVTFEAFFENTMFHEVAHGLGIKETIDGTNTVRAALREHATALEEGKADVLGLYMILALQEAGELEVDVRNNMVSFLAGIFRSTRFGAASAHGRANMIRFNFFREMGAFTRDPATGRYSVDYDRMQAAMAALSEKILRFQGDGDYDGVAAFVDEYGRIGPQLQRDLDRLARAGIPVDVVFDQGYGAFRSAEAVGD